MKTQPHKTDTRFRRLSAATVLGMAIAGITSPALRAGDTAETDSKDAKKVIEKKAEPRIKFYGLIDAGVTFNDHGNADNLNFGRLFDDRNREPLLNQATYTVERALAPEEGKFDYGFKLQGTAGTDARYLNPIGEFDRTFNGRYTVAVVEAYASLHLPVLTAGGLDLKLGQFVSPMSAETIYPTGNFFYSHTYAFNFGVPFQHLGGVAQLHVNKVLDIYAGVVRGTNVGLDDNNDVLSYLGGFQLTLLDGKLIVAGNTSIGAENDAVFGQGLVARSDGSIGRVRTNGDLRYYNNVNITIKPNDKLTLITDLVYSRDDGFRAECYSGAQYVQYALNKYVSLGLRGEIFRDDDGFFVAQFGKDDDFANITRGSLSNIDPRTVGGGDTTYAAATFGVNIKPTEKILIRPEVRYDKALDGHNAFSNSSSSHQFTGALDVVFSF